jgi:N-methylhydantoinase B/oxoprolinase/acetone carboxylase alpha subunit
MLANKNQAIVSGLLGLGVAGLAVATALPFNDRIEYRIGNRIESQPAWLVPPKAEFRAIERGYDGIKILLALLGTGSMVAVMLIARKEGEQEPVRQRIKAYQNKAYEFNYAAEAAYQMATTQTRYKKLAEADEVAFEGEIEQAYCESLGIDPQQQQAALTGTTTLNSVANPGDKVEAGTSTAIEPEPDRQPAHPPTCLT